MKFLFMMTSLLFSLSSLGAFRSSSLVMRAKKPSVSIPLDGYGSTRAMAPLYSPRGVSQKKYVKLLSNNSVDVVVCLGPAGTGKTLFACATAVQELQAGNIQKIVLTRPVVPVEEDIGYLPGNMIAKMNPWTRPIFDILEEFYSVRDIDNMLNSGVIEISPLGFMRGRTFKRAFIIADEMQNSSPNQMLMLATRLGEKSRMVVTGDLKQSDRMESNGLLDLMRKIEAFKGERDLIQMVSMGQGDVQRSEVVSKILEIYEGNVQEKEEEKARRLKIVDGF
jgi:phosphate starvation-inducible PhoH-like protein